VRSVVGCRGNDFVGLNVGPDAEHAVEATGRLAHWIVLYRLSDADAPLGLRGAEQTQHGCADKEGAQEEQNGDVDLDMTILCRPYGSGALGLGLLRHLRQQQFRRLADIRRESGRRERPSR